MKRAAAPRALLVSPSRAAAFIPCMAARLAPQLASIYVEPIAERDGYELRNQPDRSAGVRRPTRRARPIASSIDAESKSSQGVALQNDATITRYNDTLDGALYPDRRARQ